LNKTFIAETKPDEETSKEQGDIAAADDDDDGSIIHIGVEEKHSSSVIEGYLLCIISRELKT